MIKSARILINAPAKRIFDLLANPRRHRELDGTHTIVGIISGPERLSLGAKFGMKMHLGIRYRIMNTVVEFEENKLIAWRHLGRWRWRYELRSISPTQTEVTETFDGTTSISQLWLKVRKAYPWVQIAVAKTLVRLKEIAEKEFRSL
ncbi:MAG: dimethyladenosine transferase [Actinobacteria bacterium]|nr:dimethyladenosine transferase [Actinomycetota bacterium]